MPWVSSVARASSTSEPARETPRAAQPSVERLRPVWMLLLRWSRLLHDGSRPRSLSKPRPRRCRSPTDRSTQPSATLSSSTSASPSERRSNSCECSSQAVASRCRRGTPRNARRFATILGAVADADVPPPAVPAGPSFFQFADDVVFAALLRDAGFTDVQVDTMSFEVPLGSAEDLVAGLVEGTVRTGAVLRAADQAQGALIRESLEVRSSPGDAGRRTPFRRRSRSQADASRRERKTTRGRGCERAVGRERSCERRRAAFPRVAMRPILGSVALVEPAEVASDPLAVLVQVCDSMLARDIDAAPPPSNRPNRVLSGTARTRHALMLACPTA